MCIRDRIGGHHEAWYLLSLCDEPSSNQPFLQATPQESYVLDSRAVLAGTRIHPHRVPLFNEQGNLDFNACLKNGFLCSPTDCVTSDPRRRLHHLQIHKDGKIYIKRIAINIDHLHLHIHGHEFKLPLQEGFLKRQLIVGLSVHEDHRLWVSVQIRHGPPLSMQVLKLLFRAKSLVNGTAVFSITQLGAYESPTLPGLHVLVLHNLVDLIFKPDCHTCSKLIRSDQAWILLRKNVGGPARCRTTELLHSIVTNNYSKTQTRDEPPRLSLECAQFVRVDGQHFQALRTQNDCVFDSYSAYLGPIYAGFHREHHVRFQHVDGPTPDAGRLVDFKPYTVPQAMLVVLSHTRILDHGAGCFIHFVSR